MLPQFFFRVLKFFETSKTTKKYYSNRFHTTNVGNDVYQCAYNLTSNKTKTSTHTCANTHAYVAIANKEKHTLTLTRLLTACACVCTDTHLPKVPLIFYITREHRQGTEAHIHAHAHTFHFISFSFILCNPA